MRHILSVIVMVACVLTFITAPLALADEPQALLAKFLDVQKPAEQRANALGGLIANEQGVRALTDAAAKRDGLVTKAMSALFESSPPDFCEMVMFAVVRSEDRESWGVLRAGALRDKDSTVRGSAFSVAVVFADHTKEVVDAVTKEIQAAQPGPALVSAAQFAAKYEILDAIDPLLDILKNGSLGSRQLAARTLSAYSKLPENARPVLLSVAEVAQKDAARLKEAYALMPSAKDSSGKNPAIDLQEHLKEALSKIRATPHSVDAPNEGALPIPSNPD